MRSTLGLQLRPTHHVEYQNQGYSSHGTLNDIKHDGPMSRKCENEIKPYKLLGKQYSKTYFCKIFKHVYV